jgi:hypothetical protein
MPSFFLLQARALVQFLAKPVAAEMDVAWAAFKDLVDTLVREDARQHSAPAGLKKWNSLLKEVLPELQKAADAFAEALRTPEAELYRESLKEWLGPRDAPREAKEIRMRLSVRLSDMVSRMLGSSGAGEAEDSGPTVDPTE